MSLGNVDQARSVGGVAVAFTENSTLWKHCADIALCVNVAVGKARGRVSVEENGMLACRNETRKATHVARPYQVKSTVISRQFCFDSFKRTPFKLASHGKGA